MADGVKLDAAGNPTSTINGELVELHSIKVTVDGDLRQAGLSALITSTGAEGARNGTLVGPGNPLPTITVLGTPVRSTLDDSGSSQQAVAADATRGNLLLFNDSDEPVLLKLGGSASLSDFDFPVAPGQFFNMLRELGGVYRGAVHAIWANNSTGTARISDIPVA